MTTQPTTTRTATRRIRFPLPINLHTEIGAIARREGIAPAAFIRQAITAGIGRYKAKL